MLPMKSFGCGNQKPARLSDQTIRSIHLESQEERAVSRIMPRDIVASAASAYNVVTAYNDQSVYSWDVSVMQDSAMCERHEHWVTTLGITTDGNYAAIGFSDRRIELWDILDGRCVNSWSGHANRAATAMAVSHDGRQVVSSARLTIRRWTAFSDSTSTWRREGIGNPITALALTRDGNHAVSGHYDGLIKYWDLRASPALNEAHASRINAIVTTIDNRHVISASDDCTLKVWTIEQGRLLKTIKCHTNSVRDVATIDYEGDSVIASVSDDGTCCMWHWGDVAGREENNIEFKGADGGLKEGRQLFKVNICKGTGLVACAGYHRSVIVFDMRTNKRLNEICFSVGPISAMAVTPYGHVVTGHWSSHLIVSDLRTGDVFGEISLDAGRVEALNVTGKGSAIIGCTDGTLWLWNLYTQQPPKRVFEQVDTTVEGRRRNVIRGIVTDTAGNRALVASDGADLILFDSVSRGVSAFLSGHSEKITGIDVTSDWRFAVSGSDDRTVKVWDLEKRKNLATYYADGAITCVHVVNSNTFVAGGYDGGVHILTYEESHIMG